MTPQQCVRGTECGDGDLAACFCSDELVSLLSRPMAWASYVRVRRVSVRSSIRAPAGVSLARVNMEASDHLTFSVKQHTGQRVHVTGFLDAFTRAERRRMQAAVKNARNTEDVERSLVEAVRSAASGPNGGPIGKNCMSVWLAPERLAVSRFYPETDHPSNYSPHIVWSEGGRHFIVRGVDLLSPGNYGVAFGGGASTIVVRPARAYGSPSRDLSSKFQFKFAYSRCHIGPITEGEIVRVVPT